MTFFVLFNSVEFYYFTIDVAYNVVACVSELFPSLVVFEQCNIVYKINKRHCVAYEPSYIGGNIKQSMSPPLVLAYGKGAVGS